MRVPILRLDSRVLIVAFGADVTDDGVLGFQSDLSQRAVEIQARGVVIDVSALEVVDSFMARLLKDTARMLRLLGAEVVICGIQPAVAMTLVDMSQNLIDLPTAFTLERALDRLRIRMAHAERGSAPAAAADGSLRD